MSSSHHPTMWSLLLFGWLLHSAHFLKHLDKFIITYTSLELQIAYISWLYVLAIVLLLVLPNMWLSDLSRAVWLTLFRSTAYRNLPSTLVRIVTSGGILERLCGSVMLPVVCLDKILVIEGLHRHFYSKDVLEILYLTKLIFGEVTSAWKENCHLRGYLFGSGVSEIDVLLTKRL